MKNERIQKNSLIECMNHKRTDSIGSEFFVDEEKSVSEKIVSHKKIELNFQKNFIFDTNIKNDHSNNNNNNNNNSQMQTSFKTNSKNFNTIDSTKIFSNKNSLGRTNSDMITNINLKNSIVDDKV